MKHLVRLCLLVAVAGGVTLGVVSHRGAAHDEKITPRPSAPSPSQVTLSEDASGTLVGYRVVAGDALVIRLSGADMTSCALNIHTGPQSGSEHAEPGIVVDYRVVPVASWRDEAARLGQPCGEYWSMVN